MRTLEEIDNERKEILAIYADFFGDDEKRAELRKRLTELKLKRDALEIKEMKTGRDLFIEQEQS